MCLSVSVIGPSVDRLPLRVRTHVTILTLSHTHTQPTNTNRSTYYLLVTTAVSLGATACFTCFLPTQKAMCQKVRLWRLGSVLWMNHYSVETETLTRSQHQQH